MKKMSLQGQEPLQAAAAFAQHLFQQWGVGDSQCGNGAVLLLSVEDRQVSTLSVCSRSVLQLPSIITGFAKMSSTICSWPPCLKEILWSLMLPVVQRELVLQVYITAGKDRLSQAHIAAVYGRYDHCAAFQKSE